MVQDFFHWLTAHGKWIERPAVQVCESDIDCLTFSTLGRKKVDTESTMADELDERSEKLVA